MPITEKDTPKEENLRVMEFRYSYRVPSTMITMETTMPTNIGWALNRNDGNSIKYHKVPVNEPAMAETMAALLEIAFQKRPIMMSGNRPQLRSTNPTMVQNSIPLGINMANPMVNTERSTTDTLVALINCVEVALGTK